MAPAFYNDDVNEEQFEVNGIFTKIIIKKTITRGLVIIVFFQPKE